jgi:hypothetical protein
MNDVISENQVSAPTLKGVIDFRYSSFLIKYGDENQENNEVRRDIGGKP